MYGQVTKTVLFRNSMKKKEEEGAGGAFFIIIYELFLLSIECSLYKLLPLPETRESSSVKY